MFTIADNHRNVLGFEYGRVRAYALRAIGLTAIGLAVQVVWGGCKPVVQKRAGVGGGLTHGAGGRGAALDASGSRRDRA